MPSRAAVLSFLQLPQKLTDAYSTPRRYSASNLKFFPFTRLSSADFRILAFSSKNVKKKSPASAELLSLGSGNVLLSRAVSSQVPSALKGLTSVFGMGTGGTLSPLSPEFCQGLVQSAFFLASASSVYNRSFHLGELPHNLRSSSIRAYPENRTSRFLTPCEKPISYFNFPFGLT